MQPMTEYLLLNNDDSLPEISHLKPFRAIVVIESEVASDWQYKVSKWLVNSGCFYMMAWGNECSSWDDSVDFANVELSENYEVTDENLVMTTWHENEPIEKVFEFAKNPALLMNPELKNLLILHIAKESKEQQFQNMYRVA
tara:strand:- start:22 stop:444 length:423 start_codon:yes stop_codon:yes gene_type:complete